MSDGNELVLRAVREGLLLVLLVSAAAAAGQFGGRLIVGVLQARRRSRTRRCVRPQLVTVVLV